MLHVWAERERGGWVCAWPFCWMRRNVGKSFVGQKILSLQDEDSDSCASWLASLACRLPCGWEGIVVVGERPCRPERWSKTCPLHVCGGFFISIVTSATLCVTCGVIESKFGVETTMKCHLQTIHSFVKFFFRHLDKRYARLPPHQGSYGNSMVEPPKVGPIFR